MEFEEPEVLFNAIKMGIKVGCYKAHISSLDSDMYVTTSSRGSIENSIMTEILKRIDEIK
jgi:hypothetical protein